MFENLAFSLSVTMPIFLVFCTGIILKRVGWISNEFARMGSDLAFKIALPCMLFLSIIRVDFTNPPMDLLLYGLCATTVVFLILDRLVAPCLVLEDRGAFVQGSFRGNMGIVGLAFSVNAYGQDIVPMASIYIAVMAALYNVLSVITLNRHLLTGTEQSTYWVIARSISTNPLILAIVSGLLASYLDLRLPGIAEKTMNYLALMAMPLGILCSGAVIRWREFHSSVNLYWGTLTKLALVPAVIVLGGIALGLRGAELGLLFFMASAPTASSGYPMIRAIGGNHYLTAAMIATTSLGAVVFITAGLFVLRAFALV